MPTPGNEIFPTLQSFTKLASGTDTIFDVKFYPFETAKDEQIFAVVAERYTIVYRTKLGADPPFDVLSFFRDDSLHEDKPTSLNSLVWTQDRISQKPLLCVAGHRPRHVKIIDIESGKVVRTLAGHGRGINDLAISPLSNSILASAAEDNTIRVWNLEKDHEDQPCVALFAGEGHKSPVLAMHFHSNGRWLLSGGIDTAVCLWGVPDLAALKHDPGAEDKEPKIVYYPLFFSKELHANYVDCLAFYGDLVISKSASSSGAPNEILIWKIDGFDSTEPAPTDPPIPLPGERSRSAFPHDKRFRGFQRLLTLNMPHSDRFYQRFALLQAPGMRPILAMANQRSEYYFWDLQRLDEGVEPKKIRPRPQKKPAGRSVTNASSAESLDHLGIAQRSESAGESTSEPSRDQSSVGPPEKEYTLNDRFKPLEPHFKKRAETDITKIHVGTSQIAWSPDGTWMVGVGDLGIMRIFHRDKSVISAAGLEHTNGS